MYGGETRAGIDCSGLMQRFLALWGLDPPGDQSSQMLFDHFVNMSHPIKKFGSLVFYGKNDRLISHVGMCLDPDLMIEAYGTEDTKVPTPGYEVRISRVTRRKDLIAVMYPYRVGG